jgi:nucleoside-diphosphate-sugar epimerase
MRVLLTGHKGYIGVVLAPMLVRAGHEVHGYDSDLFRRCSFGEEPAAIPETIGDIRSVTREDVEGFDAIIHMAGLSNDPLGHFNPEVTYEINHAAAVRLARLAKDAGVERFVFSSSCSNYGAGGSDLLDEDGPLNPVTPYGHSKVMVERDLTAMADDRFSPVFLRNATAYGVSSRLRFDLVLNNLVAWAFTTGAIHLKSDGTAWRPLVHIEDISRAALAVLHAPREKVHARAFNVGVPNENFRIREVAEIVRETVPGAEIRYADGASADKRNYRVDCTRLPRVVPEYQPRWNVRRGAQELYDAYRRVGLTLEDFEGQRYKRIDHVRWLVREGVVDERLRHRAEGGAAA